MASNQIQKFSKKFVIEKPRNFSAGINLHFPNHSTNPYSINRTKIYVMDTAKCMAPLILVVY